MPASRLERRVGFLYDRKVEKLLIGRSFLRSGLLHRKRDNLFLRLLGQRSISRHRRSGGIVNSRRGRLFDLQAPRQDPDGRPTVISCHEKTHQCCPDKLFYSYRIVFKQFISRHDAAAGQHETFVFKSYQLFETGFLRIESEWRDENSRVHCAAC